MKTCLACSETKPYDSFYRQKAAQDGYQRYCKSCANQMSASSEKRNPGKYRAIRKKAQDKFREEMRAYKVERGCQQCGEDHPAVLELHHTDPSVKDFHPSDSTSRKLFYEEADKCIVLCANCHRKEHYH